MLDFVCIFQNLPMTPDRREWNAFSNAIRHAADFVLRVLRWEIEVCFARKNQCLCLDATHGQLEVAIVGLLVGTITRLPSMQHDEHILRVLTR